MTVITVSKLFHVTSICLRTYYGTDREGHAITTMGLTAATIVYSIIEKQEPEGKP